MKHIFASRIAHSLWRHWRWSFAWQHRICVIVLNLAKNINLPISSCEFPRKPTCGDLVEQAFEVRIVWFFCAKHGSASLHARRACLQYPTSPAAPSVKFFFFFHMDHLHEKIDPTIVANTPTITVFTSGASRGHDCPMLGA